MNIAQTGMRWCTQLCRAAGVGLALSIATQSAKGIDQIRAWTRDGIRDVRISGLRLTSGGEEIRLLDPKSSQECSIAVSGHFVLMNGILSGFTATQQQLVISRAVPKGSTAQVGDGDLRIYWGSVFGLDAIGGGSSAGLGEEVRIREIDVMEHELRLSVELGASSFGSINLSPNFRILSVELNGEALPVFWQPGSITNSSSGGSHIFRQELHRDDRRVPVWVSYFKSIEPSREGEELMIAKYFDQDACFAWIGPRDPVFFFSDRLLTGASTSARGDLVVRRAVNVDSIEKIQEDTAPSADNQAAMEQTLAIRGVSIPMETELTAVLGQPVGEVRVNRAMFSEGTIRIDFSAEPGVRGQVNIGSAGGKARVSATLRNGGTFSRMVNRQWR